MGITYTVTEERIVIASCAGHIGFADGWSAALELGDLAKQWGELFAIVVNAPDVWYELSYDQLERIAQLADELIEHLDQAAFAVVAEDDAAFGTMRQFQAVFENETRAFAVFRSEQEAMVWMRARRS